jgi:hypothetical protein
MLNPKPRFPDFLGDKTARMFFLFFGGRDGRAHRKRRVPYAVLPFEAVVVKKISLIFKSGDDVKNRDLTMHRHAR